MKLLNFLKVGKNTPHDYAFSATKEERDELCQTIITTSSPQPGFYFLLAISTIIVAVGLIKSNLILLIGGMLVAPLLSPILSLSLAILILDLKVFFRSIIIFILSALASLLVATIIGLTSDFNLAELNYLLLMEDVGLFTMLIPMAAGAAASFTWAKKNLSGALPGVAVTVTLLPPLAAMGLALAGQNYEIFMTALGVYALNVLGIIVGSLFIFLIMGFYHSEKTIVKQVEIESRDNGK
ncbi:TIGR00341 family protein [Patescibacteria group bacterium]|nr:TIGR00341 family protein [Patescibacteria group bacterium]